MQRQPIPQPSFHWHRLPSLESVGLNSLITNKIDKSVFGDWLWNPETPCKSTTVKVYILKGSQAWINSDQVPRLYLIYQPILLKLKPLDLRRHNLYGNSQLLSHFQFISETGKGGRWWNATHCVELPPTHTLCL